MNLPDKDPTTNQPHMANREQAPQPQMPALFFLIKGLFFYSELAFNTLTETEVNEMATATARKSLGEYKPLIRYDDGSTEVCEQSSERAGHHDKGGHFIRGNRMARGTTYATKEEATAAAQSVIDARRADAVARLAKYEVSAPLHLREKICADVRREILTWS